MNEKEIFKRACLIQLSSSVSIEPSIKPESSDPEDWSGE